MEDEGGIEEPHLVQHGGPRAWRKDSRRKASGQRRTSEFPIQVHWPSRFFVKPRSCLAKIARPDFTGICSTDIRPILPVPVLENRAVQNKSAGRVLAQLKELEQVVPFAKEWSQFTNHFKPTCKLLNREKKLQTPHQRLLESADIPEATKTRLRAQHEGQDPFALKKGIEEKLKKFFLAPG